MTEGRGRGRGGCGWRILHCMHCSGEGALRGSRATHAVEHPSPGLCRGVAPLHHLHDCMG